MPAATPKVIALDGPSGSGKSTVARAVARHLGWRYVDTGATYRLATLAVLRSAIDLTDTEAVAAVVAGARIELSTDPGRPAAALGGEEVGDVIRGAEVTAAVSAVSAVPAVRAQLVALQRTLAGADGAVLEGRDIGTAFFPGAPVKVYLDASHEARASRRAGDTDAGVRPAAADLLARVGADLARRDRLDSSRATSPLAAAADAIHLDSTALTADEVVARVLALADAAGLTDAGAHV